MMNIRHSCLYLIMLTSCVEQANVAPYIAYRSQGIDGARELVGWQSQINRYDKDGFYGSFSITPEYTRSFFGYKIAECLFGDALVNDACCKEYYDVSPTCCGSCPRIKIQGSKLLHRDPRALLADNFYLPTDFSSQVTFRPRVQNILVDFNLYMGLDTIAKGLYLRIHTPLCNTRWDLHLGEKVFDPGTYNYDPGYFNDSYVPAGQWNDPTIYGINRDDMVKDFTHYVSCGDSIQDIPGILYQGLEKARMSSTTKNKTGLAEITAAFGWNFLLNENYALGLNVRAAAPTGTRPHGDWLFEPIVGNGHHWELGGGLNSRICLWRNETEQEDITLYIDAYATHLFKTRQCRTFDLCNKPLSRYMLAMNMGTPVENLSAVENYVSVPPAPAIWTLTAPDAQFKKEFAPLANVSTIPVDVSYAAQGEFILKFAYTYYNWQWDLGYDFWGRSCTKISRQSDCNNTLDTNNWSLKGDAFAFGFAGQWNGDIEHPIIINVAAQGLPLSASESKATIFQGTNNWPDGIKKEVYSAFFTQPWASNPGIDNSVYCVQTPVGGSPADHLLSSKEIGKPGWVPSGTSLSPQFIKSKDLDFKAAGTRGLSHKLFIHIGYTWTDCECWTPYLGLGAMAEFGQHDFRCGSIRLHANSCCDIHMHGCRSCLASIQDNDHGCSNVAKNNSCCTICALSQWGAWIKGGISFN